jgi:hypothetical protein
MKYKILIILLSLIPLITFVQAEINVYEFYSATCPHCINVKNSGILEKVEIAQDVTLQSHEVSTPGGFLKYEEYKEKTGAKEGVPFAVVECEGGELQYLMGDTPIINGLEQAVENCRTENIPSGKNNALLYIIIIIIVVGAIGLYYLYNKKKK